MKWIEATAEDLGAKLKRCKTKCERRKALQEILMIAFKRGIEHGQRKERTEAAKA